MKSFPSSLRYKIHVKDEHKGVEPMENYDPEKCVQPDDFICLICIKKFKNRNGLKLHIQNFHLAGSSLKHLSDEKEMPDKEEEGKAGDAKAAEGGEKSESAEGKSESSEGKSEAAEEKDPLADPLETSQDETKEEPACKSDESREGSSEKSCAQTEEQPQASSEKKEESSEEATVSKEESNENSSEKVSAKDEGDKKDEKESPTTVDEDGESKKETSVDENQSKSREGEGVEKVTEIINLENGKDDSEKKSDSDSKDLQKNGVGESKDDDEIMIIGKTMQLSTKCIPD